MSARLRLIVMCAACVAGASLSLQAYLKLGVVVGTTLVGIRWDRQVDYLVTNRDVDGVTAPQLQGAIDRAFATWASTPRVAISHRFVGFTEALPVTGDAISVIGFRARPEFERTLAAASFDIDESTGRIIEADIFFNTIQPWSVAPAGVTGRFDIESVGLHEVGHLLGLGHSALGETTLLESGARRVTGKAAVMFPIAYPAGNIEDRTLEPDDKAGIADIYGTADALRRTGAISGTVRSNGRGVFGAHVVAVQLGTGEMISGFTVTRDGDFAINRLSPGLYVLRVEPLDDADIGSFIDDDAGVDTDFDVTFHPRLVAVPAGGQGPAVRVEVRR